MMGQLSQLSQFYTDPTNANDPHKVEFDAFQAMFRDEETLYYNEVAKEQIGNLNYMLNRWWMNADEARGFEQDLSTMGLVDFFADPANADNSHKGGFDTIMARLRSIK